jgi:flagellar protein FliO/FliZ
MVKSFFYALLLLVSPLLADTHPSEPAKEAPAAAPAKEAPAAPAPAPVHTPVAPIPAPPVPPEVVMQGYEGAFLKMFLTLIALVVAIFFTVWALKRLARGKFHHMNSNRTIKIIERRALSPKTVLYVIEVAGKQAVVAESQLEVKRILTLEEFNEPLDKSSLE